MTMMSEIRRLGKRTRTVLADEGLRGAVRHSAQKLLDYAEYPLQRRAWAGKQFTAHGMKYTYFVHLNRPGFHRDSCY